MGTFVRLQLDRQGFCSEDVRVLLSGDEWAIDSPDTNRAIVSITQKSDNLTQKQECTVHSQSVKQSVHIKTRSIHIQCVHKECTHDKK